MMSDNTGQFVVPVWVWDNVNMFRDLLNLGNLEIQVEMQESLDGDPDCQGMTCQYPELNKALIILRADAENDPYWRQVIAHEMMHIAHIRVDSAVDSVLIPELDEALQSMATRVYNIAVESFTHHMAVVLARMVS